MFTVAQILGRDRSTFCPIMIFSRRRQNSIKSDRAGSLAFLPGVFTYFIWQSEKLSVTSELEIRSERELIGDEFLASQTGQILFHCARRHVDGFGNRFCRDPLIISAVGMAAAEIGQDHKLSGFKIVLPYHVGEWEAIVTRIESGPANRDATFSH